MQVKDALPKPPVHPWVGKTVVATATLSPRCGEIVQYLVKVREVDLNLDPPAVYGAYVPIIWDEPDVMNRHPNGGFPDNEYSFQVIE